MKKIVLLLLFIIQFTFPKGFVPGTLVKVSDGYKPVEEIQEGDYVVCTNDYGVTFAGRALFVVEQEVDQLVKITLKGEDLYLALDQQINTGNWVCAEDLIKGLYPKNLTDHDLRIEQIEIIDSNAIVYDLTVETYGHFYVSQHDILAHNFIVAAAPLVAPSVAITTIKVGGVVSGALASAAAAWGVKKGIAWGSQALRQHWSPPKNRDGIDSIEQVLPKNGQGGQSIEIRSFEDFKNLPINEKVWEPGKESVWRDGSSDTTYGYLSTIAGTMTPLEFKEAGFDVCSGGGRYHPLFRVNNSFITLPDGTRYTYSYGLVHVPGCGTPSLDDFTKQYLMAEHGLNTLEPPVDGYKYFRNRDRRGQSCQECTSLDGKDIVEKKPHRPKDPLKDLKTGVPEKYPAEHRDNQPLTTPAHAPKVEPFITPVSTGHQPTYVTKDKGGSEGSDTTGSGNDQGAQAPGKPTEKDGYIPPKKGDGKKVRHPETGKVGYPDKDGNVWVPTGPGGGAHGGPHWDVQYRKSRRYDNVFPGGKVKPGKK